MKFNTINKMIIVFVNNILKKVEFKAEKKNKTFIISSILNKKRNC